MAEFTSGSDTAREGMRCTAGQKAASRPRPVAPQGSRLERGPRAAQTLGWVHERVSQGSAAQAGVDGAGAAVEKTVTKNLKE